MRATQSTAATKPGGQGPLSTSLRGLLPPPGYWDPEHPQDYTRFRDRIVNWDLPYRNAHISRITRNWWYYLGRQHITQDQAAWRQAANGFVWRDIRQLRGSRPRPTTNKAAVQIDNEVARLSRKEYVFSIWTDSGDPTVMTGARTAKQVMDYKLEGALRWPEKRDYSHLVYTLEGGTTHRVGWDISQTKLLLAPVESARRCARCQNTLASPVVPQKALRSMVQGGKQLFNLESVFDLPLEDDPEAQPQAMLKDCPSCDARGSLQPYDDMNPDEMQQDDLFGRPLGEELPAGDVDLEVVHAHELFYSNGGLGTDPTKIRVIGRVIPQDVEWLEERYPEFAKDFRPEDPQDLMRVHPLLGETDYLHSYSSGLCEGIYDNHMMTYEFRILPYMDCEYDEAGEKVLDDDGGESLVPNRGRYIFLAGDQLCLEDTALEIPYQDYKGRTRYIPRVFFHQARHRKRPGEAMGNGQMDDLISPQNRLNRRDGQSIQTLDLFASPQILAPRDARINGPEWHTPGAGRYLLYDVSPMNPQAKPEIFQAGSLPADAWREREANALDIQELGGGGEVELGQIPAGLKTTSGLVVAGDNMGQRRQPRERSLKYLYTDTFKSVLKMLAALRTEDETYEMDAPGSSMTKVHTFRGSDLCEQFNVRISAEAGIEKDIYTREAAAEAKTEGLYDLSDPVARRKYLEMRGLPEINETFKRQIDRAQKAAGAFLDKATLPPLDPYSQHPGIWYATLGEIWLSDELSELQCDLGWDEFLPTIAGWEKELDDLIQKDVLARKFYSGMTPEQAQGIYQQALADQAKAIELQKQAAAAPPPPGMAGPPPMQPLAPLPPEPVFIPPAYERRIFEVTAKLMGTQGADWDHEPDTPPEEEAEKYKPQALHPNGLSASISVERLHRLYCIIHAFRLHAEEREGKRAQGAPMVPMPGGDPLAALSAAAGPGGPAGAGRQTNTPSLPEPPPALPGAAQNAVAGGTVPQAGA